MARDTAPGPTDRGLRALYGSGMETDADFEIQLVIETDHGTYAIRPADQPDEDGLGPGGRYLARVTNAVHQMERDPEDRDAVDHMQRRDGAHDQRRAEVVRKQEQRLQEDHADDDSRQPNRQPVVPAAP